ncbi:hypothetical protein Astex_0156 [Asticcacaulis excentricus CB 48]|uniref:Uncharacterized protein n=1 Tax=Asticcacaulis excentricus (strain ATCC 15261 / DSM 4724 / KCTC 12464 / NCIMB 9791 / VKM B-1370 / CB 48) TaxID=573065 RepID=E8RNU4_ASTEC|nr:hypothetical protein Astex_0156 [Asticcacaulis excentricus CB 48]
MKRGRIFYMYLAFFGLSIAGALIQSIYVFFAAPIVAIVIFISFDNWRDMYRRHKQKRSEK